MTDEAKALVERLLAWEPLVSTGHEVPAAGRAIHEAARLIETQAREIERLSYALGCIANEDWKDMTVGSARDLALAALGESHE